MISDAYVRVECNACGEDEEINLTSLAGGGWDDRNVSDYLEKRGWDFYGDTHTCPDCLQEIVDEEDEDEEDDLDPDDNVGTF